MKGFDLQNERLRFSKITVPTGVTIFGGLFLKAPLKESLWRRAQILGGASQMYPGPNLPWLEPHFVRLRFCHFGASERLPEIPWTAHVCLVGQYNFFGNRVP